MSEALPAWTFYDIGSELRSFTARRLFAALDEAAKRKQGILAARDTAALAAHGRQVRQAFLRAIGGPVRPAGGGFGRCGETETGALAIEKLLYEADGAKIPALLYTRRGQQGQRPGILFLCGHEADGKHNPRYQAVCQMLALHGFAVLCPDVAGQGERAEGPPGTPPLAPTAAHSAAGLPALAAGGNPARFLVQDVMAGLNVLQALPMVQPGQLAVTGNSGGGTQSIMLALADERVQAAAVGTFLSSHEAIFASGKPQDAEQVWANTLTPALGIDHDDMLWAFAPKPLLILAAQDDFFPFEGTLATAHSAREAYRLLGAEERFALYSEETGHQYTLGMARQAAAFFAQHFGFAALDAPESDIQPLPAERLFCTANGNVATAFPAAATLKSRADALLAGQAGPPAALFEDASPAPRAKQADALPWNGLACRRLLFEAAAGLHGVLACFTAGAASQNGECDLFLWPGGTAECAGRRAALRESCAAGRTAVVCDLPAMGSAAPPPVNGMPLHAPFGTLYLYNAWLLRTGTSLCALRVQALRRAAGLLQAMGLRVTLHAEGPCRLYGALAGLLREADARTALAWLRDELLRPQPDDALWPCLPPGIFARHGT